ncbi:MAG: tryptophan--tRNA ligase [Candidatus Acidiferrales bacterium]
MAKQKRVLSGMRPTGRLHLGHYFGALQNWLKLQNSRLPAAEGLPASAANVEGRPEYECFFFVADWHALTTHYEDTSSVAENTLQVVTDWLAVGLDPEKSTLFVQSNILEHAELHVLLSMITPLSWLERVPTYKEQIENLKDRDLGTYGFLGYPLLQAADIVMYGDPKVDLLVPVGEDQAPHVELTREVVRRFNTQFGLEIKDALLPTELSGTETLERVLDSTGTKPPKGESWEGVEFRAAFRSAFRRRAAEIGIDNFFNAAGKDQKFFREERVLREPGYVAAETPRLPGTDGRRMAKSYGNAIWLSDPPDQIRDKARNMMTDPQRVRRTDQGRPEVCPVFAYHKLFSPPDVIAWSDQGCRTAGIGCVDCKRAMADQLVRWIEPIQTRRKEFEAHPEQVWDILDRGSDVARKSAKRTMKRVRNAIFKWDEARKASAPPRTKSTVGSD